MDCCAGDGGVTFMIRLLRFLTASSQALKQGISQGVNRIQSGEKIVPNDGDFIFQSKDQLMLPPSSPLPQGLLVQWKDYCPFVFRYRSSQFHAPSTGSFVCRHMRQELGVDPGHYLSNICDGNMNISPTAGRSGAIFMVPDGGKFFLKSLTKNESKTLRVCLKAYHAYMVTHPDTLLCRIYGMYRVVCKQGTFRFVVINNVFDTSRIIHERFDLKGSMINRRAVPSDYVRTIYKDQDILEKGRRLRMSRDVGLQLRQQLTSDVQFLCSQGLMDYSFLVGVHHRAMADAVDLTESPQQQSRMEEHSNVDDFGFDEVEQKKSVFCRDDGGVPGADSNEVTNVCQSQLSSSV
jgi:hypothetical protein